MKKSSNIDMEEVFEYLANIKKSEPSINLYTQTLNRTQKQNVISLFWVSAVACLLILFISIEIYLLSNKENNYKQEISNFVPTTNNILYNE